MKVWNFLNNILSKKIEKIHEILKNKSILIAFSGGVDSSIIANLAKDVCDRILAITINSKIITEDELLNAKNVANNLSIEWKQIDIDVFSNQKFVKNPPDRCYYCKKKIMEKLLNIAEIEHLDFVIDGTNASDLQDHRPGFLALKELNIKSPLAEAGITKNEIRQIAKIRGLNVWQRPSMACLASRIPYGEKITEEKLKMIEKAEKFIQDTYDIKVVRVRCYKKLARIEVGKKERKKILSEEILNDITSHLKELGFTYITLDLEGYRIGSMNEII